MDWEDADKVGIIGCDSELVGSVGNSVSEACNKVGG